MLHTFLYIVTIYFFGMLAALLAQGANFAFDYFTALMEVAAVEERELEQEEFTIGAFVEGITFWVESRKQKIAAHAFLWPFYVGVVFALLIDLLFVLTILVFIMVKRLFDTGDDFPDNEGRTQVSDLRPQPPAQPAQKSDDEIHITEDVEEPTPRL